MNFRAPGAARAARSDRSRATRALGIWRRACTDAGEASCMHAEREVHALQRRAVHALQRRA
eukprot:4270561-Pleurochrysis_carterae.AAC.1